MKVTLYMATTIDGFIADSEGNTDWIPAAEESIFDSKAESVDAIVVGLTTFKQYEDEIYPIEGKWNIVVSSDESRATDEQDKVVFVDSPESAVAFLNEKGCNKVLLVGGGTINASFLKIGLIDEIHLTVCPNILGSGIKLFASDDLQIVELEKRHSEELSEGMVHIQYKRSN